MSKIKIEGFSITFGYDEDAESPLDWNDDCKLYSFSNRHINYKHPDNFDLGSIGMRRKLECGTAFLLSYYEHGNCQWSLLREGPRCQWDTVDCAGILLMDRKVAKTYSERRTIAKQLLREYTTYCNGQVMHYIIRDKDGDVVDSCGGFYDYDHCEQEARDAVQYLVKMRDAEAINVDYWNSRDVCTVA